MTGLLRMLAGILRDHIEHADTYPPPTNTRLPKLTDNEVAEHLRDGVEPWRIDERQIDGGWYGGEYPRLWPPRHPGPGGVRPCWCCGHPGGFTDPHHCIQHHNPGSQPHTYWSTQ